MNVRRVKRWRGVRGEAGGARRAALVRKCDIHRRFAFGQPSIRKQVTLTDMRVFPNCMNG
jgi:hypothetical protein